jgi:type IV pilus assembly protein PilM
MAFSLGRRTSVGLDIGSTAVRVAELSGSREAYVLKSFGQSALPQGAVVDGEIRDAGAVSEAIAQLWKRTKLSKKHAVIGLANQRVVVRQVDFPYLEENEFRQALRFQAAEYIPMPVDEAQLDFIVVDDFTTANNEHMMRVLLVAAAIDTVESFIGAVGAAGIQPDGVDLIPFAVARAVSRAARGEIGVEGSEAIVDVGGGVTNVIIHVNGEPRFVRILLIGGDDATTALAEELGVEFDEAEAVKLDLGRDVGPDAAKRILDRQVASLVEEIRGSLDYYLSQDDSEPITSIIVTGGGSLTAGFVNRLETTLRTPVFRGTPLEQLSAVKAGLTEDQVRQVEPVAAAAVGLAIGALEK